MSLQYDAYLKEHIDNVYNGYLWILGHIEPEKLDKLLPGIKWDSLMMQIKSHDWSKRTEEEYGAYDAYFYGTGSGPAGKAPEVQRAFDRAWLHHIHNNLHHWQHWVLIDDEGDNSNGDKYKPLDIPNECIIEMICDWWSFSWKKGDLREIFNWWDEHLDKVIMTDSSREKVEGLLAMIREGIEQDEKEKRRLNADADSDMDILGFDGVVPIGGVVKVDEVDL
mgnify:CR=1 FL=1